MVFVMEFPHFQDVIQDKLKCVPFGFSGLWVSLCIKEAAILPANSWFYPMSFAGGTGWCIHLDGMWCNQGGHGDS